MDTGTVATEIVALAAILTIVVTIRFRGQDMSAKTLQDALRPINEALIRHDKDHAHHYAVGDTVVRVAQQLTEHEKHDDERFDDLREMQKEIRDDVKTLLSR